MTTPRKKAAPKSIQLMVRLDDAESERLNALAAHYGLPGAATVRMLLKRDADALNLGDVSKAARRALAASGRAKG